VSGEVGRRGARRAARHKHRSPHIGPPQHSTAQHSTAQRTSGGGVVSAVAASLAGLAAVVLVHVQPAAGRAAHCCLSGGGRVGGWQGGRVEGWKGAGWGNGPRSRAGGPVLRPGLAIVHPPGERRPVAGGSDSDHSPSVKKLLTSLVLARAEQPVENPT